MKPLPAFMQLAAPVRDALARAQPVVALESTIITHGMPWPVNFETARAAEHAVREAGATPATIALLDGMIRVGVTEAELEGLAQAAAQDATALRKCSVRDLAPALIQTDSGGTTVAATMRLAARVGIAWFATGGIGGVHRGAQDSFDQSADLLELARSPVGVICAGPKAILDLGLTLEVLETQGVPVLGYGTDELPAFWSRSSGFPVDARLDSPAAIAATAAAHWSLGAPGGLLITQPVPAEHELPAREVEVYIQRALRQAADAGVTGKAVTPYLLERVLEATGGACLRSNQALMVANARLAGEAAVAYGALGAASTVQIPC